MVSEPSSNYLVKRRATNEILRRVVYEEPEQAILKAVTSPEDRLGEECCLQHRIVTANVKFKDFLNLIMATIGNVGDLELAP